VKVASGGSINQRIRFVTKLQNGLKLTVKLLSRVEQLRLLSSCCWRDTKICMHNKKMWFSSHKKMQLVTCEVNFVVESITMYNMCCLLWHVLHWNGTFKARKSYMMMTRWNPMHYQTPKTGFSHPNHVFDQQSPANYWSQLSLLSPNHTQQFITECVGTLICQLL
jgi:hypothetical protein